MEKGKSRTAKFYQTHPESRKKHSKDNSGQNSRYGHSAGYQKKHREARKSLKIRPGSGVDASKQPDGSFKREPRKANRGRGGASRK